MSDIKFERKPLLKPSTRDRLKGGAGVAAVIFGFIAASWSPEEEQVTPEEERQNLARHYDRQGCDTHDFVENGGLIECPDDLDSSDLPDALDSMDNE